MEILRNVNKIDFQVLYSGKVCIDEVNRVRRIARLDCIRLPRFMDNMDKYKQSLLHIAAINKIVPIPAEKMSSGQSKYVLNSSNLRVSWMSKPNTTDNTPSPTGSKVGTKQRKKPRKVAVPPTDKPKTCMVIHGAKANVSKPVQLKKSKSYSYESTFNNSGNMTIVIDGTASGSKDAMEKEALPKYRLLKRHQSASNKLG